ncbi:hypothetical protein [Streptomyces flavidovirens]|uniref:hypothetical protein n=1 Tax=Streptomyces flavidovirens TaxID=67298 RepID=UPI0036BB3694
MFRFLPRAVADIGASDDGVEATEEPVDLWGSNGITDDTNDWSEDSGYNIDLLKQIVTVSLETMEIVDGLAPGTAWTSRRGAVQ